MTSWQNTTKHNSVKRGAVHYGKAQYSTGHYEGLTYTKGHVLYRIGCYMVRINTEMCGKTITTYGLINNNLILILQKYCQLIV